MTDGVDAYPPAPDHPAGGATIAPSHPDRRAALTALGVTTTLLPLAAAAATGGTASILVPGAPTGLTITYTAGPDGEGRYTYEGSWSAPTEDGGAAIDLYEHGLWAGASPIVTGTQLVTSTTYLEDPSQNGGLIQFRVRARNSVGWGPYEEVSLPIPP